MRLVKIVWRDIQSVVGDEGAWMEKAVMLDKATRLYEDEHSTVGYIVDETENFFVVAATTDHDCQFADASMIPKAVVCRVEELTVEKRNGNLEM